MIVLDREEFDAIEFDAACTGDHRGAAKRMSGLAETGAPTAGMSRAEAFLRAGEEWLLADEPAIAVAQFQRALADGGPASTDARAPLARALFLLGEDDEAEALIAQLAAEAPADPRLCDQIAELLLERSDLTGSLAWATAGVELCLGVPPAPICGAPQPHAVPVSGRPAAGATLALAGAGDLTELRLLLRLRFRVRNDLGLSEDDYDRLLDELPSEPGQAAAG